MSLIPYGPPIDDDEEDEVENRAREEFDIEEGVRDFTDEPAVDHNIFPDSDDDDEAEAEQDCRTEDDLRRRSSGVMFKGQVFMSRAAFKEIVLDHALKTGRNIRQYRYDTRNSGFIFVGGAKGQICEWRVYCSKSSGSDVWKIKVLKDKHCCEPNGECEMMKVPMIARLFLNKIREEPEYYLPMKIEQIILDKWKIKVSRPQCQSARNKALKWLENEYDQQFQRIRDYGSEIELCNPNSSVAIETETNSEGVDVFNRFYVCFDALRRAWRGTCRHLIGMDGCFLKGKMKGELLVALGCDGNNEIYPIAWAVVQVENTSNWLWFVKKVRDDLELGDGDGYVLISDRQKGLIRAVEVAMPMIEHRMCVRHVYANLKSKFGKRPQMKPLVWSMAWAYNEANYNEHLRRLMEYDETVYEHIVRQHPEQWCKAFQTVGSCCEDVENNSTESFNASVYKARQRPLVPMLEIIARQAIVRIDNRSVQANDHQGLCTPYAQKQLAKSYEYAAECRVYRSTNMLYQVVQDGCSYRVCMQRKVCSCRKWEVTGIPCEHAYAVVISRKLEITDYVAHWFKTAVWRMTYDECLTPTRGAKFWPQGEGPAVHQPPEPRQPGRKKKTKSNKRRKGTNESPVKKKQQRVMHCGICGAAGHNSRFHKQDPQPIVAMTQGDSSSQAIISQPPLSQPASQEG